MGWAFLLLAVVLAASLAIAVDRLHRSRDEARRLAETLDERQVQLERLAAEAAAERAVEPEPVEPLEADRTLIDPESGLYNDEFFRVTLDARVAAARRHLRPVAVILLRAATGVRDGGDAPTDPAIVGACLRDTLRDADTACHLDDGRYGLILEDTPENGAVWTVERIRRALAERHPGQTMWAGVACYPAHAFDAAELLERTAKAFDAATEWRQDRIEVAANETS